MTLKNFEIAEEYLTQVVVHEEMKFTNFTPMGSMTQDQIDAMNEMMDKPVKVTRWIDHPEFTKLREQLEVEGYIIIQRSWWNGDRVLRSFKVNGLTLKKGSTFYCAAALGNIIAVARSMKRKSIDF